MLRGKRRDFHNGRDGVCPSDDNRSRLGELALRACWFRPEAIHGARALHEAANGKRRPDGGQHANPAERAEEREASEALGVFRREACGIG